MQGAATGDETADKPSEDPVTILIAEDSESSQALFSLFFKGMNSRLVFAKNGREAVAAYKAGAYDLVLMDIFMPLMDGLDATREIRAHEQANNLRPTPIVTISANDLPEDRDCSAKAGCTDFLPKPVRKAALLECVARILGDR
ncbi:MULTISPECIES: response regulator [unclassified Pseudodesulfovibrio]|uniref:response regulator n=1 Tax=unclassified Pseudodesulfovibrio TaxID=2661612 RepID=UPI000FEB918A|nr:MULTISPECIES: response regulator [unclassified Pseudodesulfovibrio]MCJ2165894.1 response regulator [Pseudodesulfovibrio sp. S3-i]RWU02673.1 response regulator [Pseudodesulfovibrio sp. S3]